MLRSGMVRAVGTMSGTSLDGVDAALIETDGIAIAGFGKVGYRPYTAAEQDVLRAALGRWPGEPRVSDAARIVEAAHVALLANFAGAELVGFHGQTLAHDPRGTRRTHQAGSGARLAAALGTPVAWDFRSEDVAQGGEGAPLAPFFHFACAQWAGLSEPVAFLNLGGVGNVTWLDPRAPAPEAPGALLAFDTGPANAPINDLMHRRRGQSCDAGGALALAGQADAGVLARFLEADYFRRPPPKSLDRDTFAGLQEAVSGLSDADAAATLTGCAAAAVAQGLAQVPSVPAAVYVCGGGRHNRAMMTALSERTGLPVRPVEVLGLDGDMLEAQAFGWLAVRVARGLPTSGPSTTGAPAPLCGGQLSHP